MNNQNPKCSICGTTVDIKNMHPDSLEIPDKDEYTVLHAGCANGEDRYNGAQVSDEDLADERAWIKLR